MRRRHPTVSILCLTALCLACGGAGDEAEKQAAGGAESDSGFVASLSNQAKGLFAGGEDDAGSGSALSAKATDPIVRCRINGTVEFTNASRCEVRGGQGTRMVLKAKNDR